MPVSNRLYCGKCGYSRFFMNQKGPELPDGKVNFETECAKCHAKGDAIKID